MTGIQKIITKPIHRNWNPTIQFNLNMAPKQKRLLARFQAFKNYRERQGRPVQFWADPLATDEIIQLRNHISVLVRALDNMYRFWSYRSES